MLLLVMGVLFSEMVYLIVLENISLDIDVDYLPRPSDSIIPFLL
jgi:hypothetical protein